MFNLVANYQESGGSEPVVLDGFIIRTYDTNSYQFNSRDSNVDVEAYDTNENLVDSWTNLSGTNTLNFPSSDLYDLHFSPTIENSGVHLEMDNHITDIKQWGNIKWSSMSNTFNGTNIDNMTATDVPDLSNVSNFVNMFQNSSFNQDIDNWVIKYDNGNINFGNFLRESSSFNGKMFKITYNHNSININFFGMFFGATSFNQPLDHWEFYNITPTVLDSNFNYMFQNASSYNQDLSSWDVSGAKGIPNNFDYGATSWDFINKPIWIQKFEILIDSTISDSQNDTFSIGLNNAMDVYDVDIYDAQNNYLSTVANISSYHNLQLPQPGTYFLKFSPNSSNGSGKLSMNFAYKSDLYSLEKWGDYKFSTMRSLFNLSGLSVINATDIPDLSSLTDMYGVFTGVNLDKLPSNVNLWDTSNITNIERLFYNTSGNINISNWNVSNVTNMKYLISSNSDFNQDLSGWCVSSVTDHQYFDQNTSSWQSNYKPNFSNPPC